MRIGEICTRNVVTCLRSASAIELSRTMRDQHVGDVVIIDDSDGAAMPCGIVTDRDLVVQVLAAGVDPAMLCAEDLLGGDVVTALESEDVYDAIWHMRSRGVRRLPVVDAKGHLLGMLTADDVTEFLAAELSEVARIMPRQIKLEQAHRGPSVQAAVGISAQEVTP